MASLVPNLRVGESLFDRDHVQQRGLFVIDHRPFRNERMIANIEDKRCVSDADRVLGEAQREAKRQWTCSVASNSFEMASISRGVFWPARRMSEMSIGIAVPCLCLSFHSGSL